MSWNCRLIENPELDEYGNVDLKKRQVGDMWYLDLSEEELKERHLTKYYWEHNSSRKPIVLALPILYYGGPEAGYYMGINPFVVDGQCFNTSQGYYDGWTVNGVPPLLTISPSINMVDRYHGWLQNGVLSDDVDGRKYEPRR